MSGLRFFFWGGGEGGCQGVIPCGLGMMGVPGGPPPPGPYKDIANTNTTYIMYICAFPYYQNI